LLIGCFVETEEGFEMASEKLNWSSAEEIPVIFGNVLTILTHRAFKTPKMKRRSSLELASFCM
jgi:hypothetical protein